MPAVTVQLIEYLPDDQPELVAAQLIDAFGAVHVFHDQVSTFHAPFLDRDRQLPAPAWLRCEVLNRFRKGGRELVHIDTERPFDVESTNGLYQFVVAADSLFA